MTFEEARKQFRGIYLSFIRKYHTNASIQKRDDLVQVGEIAIWKALESFDKSKDVKLSTHVYNTIYFDFMNHACSEAGISRGKYERLKKEDSLPHIVGHNNFEEIFGKTNESKDTHLIWDEISYYAKVSQLPILELLKNGLSQSEISEELHLSRQRISRQLKDLKDVLKKFEVL